ncbi:MAG TPA: hypothetical protein VKB50_29170 [Vicinamibacterales bacterium]|nr:hypothetical protein [Vicinamibacterales bacterium]
MSASRPPTFSSRLAKYVRGRGDGARRAYIVGRRLLAPKSYWARRRVATSVSPAAGVAVRDDDGYRLFHAGAFPEADAAAQRCVSLAGKSEDVLRERRKAHADKQFLVNLLDLSTLTADHPLLLLALRPDLLDAVIAYIGTVPILRSLQVFYSGAVDREPISSQLYHCDADDVRQLKIFLLCSEVGNDNGPLTILDAASSDRVRRATHYTYIDRLDDEQVAAIGGVKPPVELVGPPGTMCLVDTSRCFHYGSRVRAGAGPRLVAMAQYLSPFAFVAPHGTRGALAHLANGAHTSLQRAVLTGDHGDLW